MPLAGSEVQRRRKPAYTETTLPARRSVAHRRRRRRRRCDGGAVGFGVDRSAVPDRRRSVAPRRRST